MATKGNSRNSRLLTYLQTNKDVSLAQASNRFGVSQKTVLNTISRLRAQGHAIYRNTITTANGNKMNVYRLGTPTQRVVAAGYAALSLARTDTFIRLQLQNRGIL